MLYIFLRFGSTKLYDEQKKPNRLSSLGSFYLSVDNNSRLGLSSIAILSELALINSDGLPSNNK